MAREEYSEHVAFTVQLLEETYPEFLTETGAVDSTISRITYYGMMIEVLSRSTSYVWIPQVIEILENRREKEFAEFRKKLRLDPE